MNSLLRVEAGSEIMKNKEGDFMAAMKITLKQSDYEKILDHARKEAPDETCAGAGIDRGAGARRSRKCTF